MQENNSRSSFFDDDDLNIKFEFRKPEKRDQKELALPPTVKEFLLFKGPGSSTTQQGFYALHDHVLGYYKNSKDKSPDQVLDLAHSRFKALPAANAGAQSGFSVSKNGNTFEFYSQDKNVIDAWTESLKNVCVLTTFHDEYKALKMIGRGSFAKVYLVESKSNGKMYAVKAFTKESIIISNKSNAKPSMLNEIEIMRALDHENVIKLYEVFETDKSIYLVLELIQGKSLQEILKKSSFKEEFSEVKVINMIRSILDALSYLAAKGVMHRDLKPDNILLDKGDKIKIVDFGLATFIDVPEYIFKKCGTPGYIAPEVFKYDPKVPASSYDGRCDVFSAGAILFYMLFGYPFFEGGNASEILKTNRKFAADYETMNMLKNEIKNAGSKINKDGMNLCLQLLEFDQKKRITAHVALNHPYFIPTPGDMHKITGSNESVSDSLSRYSGGNYEKISPTKRPDEYLKHKNSVSSITNKGDRFAEKDSLYLDMGKPELNGKIDTLTSGSQNNSLLLQKDPSSNANLGSLSGFAKQGSEKKLVHTRSFKNQGSGGQSFLKAAIFRNMEKNRENGEESKEDPGPTRDSPGLPKERRFSESLPKSYDNDSPDDEDDEVSNENPQVQVNFEKIKTGTPDKNPGKMMNNSNRRFTPFANKG